MDQGGAEEQHRTVGCRQTNGGTSSNDSLEYNEVGAERRTTPGDGRVLKYIQ